jgi:hypothetical protein
MGDPQLPVPPIPPPDFDSVQKDIEAALDSFSARWQRGGRLTSFIDMLHALQESSPLSARCLSWAEDAIRHSWLDPEFPTALRELALLRLQIERIDSQRMGIVRGSRWRAMVRSEQASTSA